MSASLRVVAANAAALGIRGALRDAAAGALGVVGIARRSDGIPRRCRVPAETSLEVAHARRAVDVVAAGRPTVAGAGTHRILIASEVDATAALVRLGGLSAQFTAGQTIGEVVGGRRRSGVVENDAFGGGIDRGA